MTSSRVVRGTKGRIIFCVCAILMITAVIVCYNNTLSQLEDVRRTNDQCHQQQENLSTQLQVIFDYKQRLEKSLKTEKAQHQQIKKDLEKKIEEERLRNEKVTNEDNLKLSSLQQQYNMLQAEYEDYKEEGSKIQQQQLSEINDLQSKLKEMRDQLKQAASKLEHLKSEFLHLQIEKENLQKQIKATQGSHTQSESEMFHLMKVNHELQRELAEIKSKYLSTSNDAALQASQNPLETDVKHSVLSSFSKQVDIGNSLYQIRESQQLNNKELSSVADLPLNVNQHSHLPMNQLHLPKLNKDPINNNENVLAAPNNEINEKSSSSEKPVTKKSVSTASLDAVKPLNVPTVTPSNLKSKPSQESRILNHDPHVLPIPFTHKKLPVEIVPAPRTSLDDNSKKVASKIEPDEKDIREDVNNAFPNRYRSNLILSEFANEDKAKEADKQERINEVKNGKDSILKSDVGDKENNALEVFDSPLHDHDKTLNGDPFGMEIPQDMKVNVKQDEGLLKKSINSGAKLHDGHKVYDGQDGGDYDKDVQLEENDPEGEDDDPVYADHIAHHKDPAIRN